MAVMQAAVAETAVELRRQGDLLDLLVAAGVAQQQQQEQQEQQEQLEQQGNEGKEAQQQPQASEEGAKLETAGTAQQVAAQSAGQGNQPPQLRAAPAVSVLQQQLRAQQLGDLSGENGALRQQLTQLWNNQVGALVRNAQWQSFLASPLSTMALLHSSCGSGLSRWLLLCAPFLPCSCHMQREHAAQSEKLAAAMAQTQQEHQRREQLESVVAALQMQIKALLAALGVVPPHAPGGGGGGGGGGHHK